MSHQSPPSATRQPGGELADEGQSVDEHGEVPLRPRGPGWLRAGLIFYLGVELLVGAWAAAWPRSFYDDFPWPGHPWVEPFAAVDAIAQPAALVALAVLPLLLLTWSVARTSGRIRHRLVGNQLDPRTALPGGTPAAEPAGQPDHRSGAPVRWLVVLPAGPRRPTSASGRSR